MSANKLNSRLLSAPEALIKMGVALMRSGQGAKAVGLVRNLLAQASGDGESAAVARAILSHQIPSWHAGMLRDEARNAAYERSIARAVGPDSRVLDIGTGSGILAMIAARAGARSVVACEADPALAETAREIVAMNGMSERVKVLARNSTDLDMSDLGGRADVIVAEVFSDNLLAESAVATLADARSRLAAASATMIPQAASLRVALAFHQGAHIRQPPKTVSGFDLTAFEPHSPSSFPVSVDSPKLRLSSEAIDLFAFDFQAGKAGAQGRTQVKLIVSDGPANGLVQWIRLRLDPEETYENRPGPKAKSHWAALFHPLPCARQAAPGEEVIVNAFHDCERLVLWFV